MLRCKTSAFTKDQTHEYIGERLRIAGADAQPVFGREAMDAVYFYSLGIPRVINLLCEHSLVNAYVEKQRPVMPNTVEEVAREFQLDEVSPIAAAGLSTVNTDVYNSEAFLQNLGEALSRFRFGPPAPHERK